MEFEEYMNDLEYIWTKMKPAGYTYLATGAAVAFFLVWLYFQAFG